MIPDVMEKRRAPPVDVARQRVLVMVAVCALFTRPAGAQEQSRTFRVFGYANARAIAVRAQPSWIEGGFGRFGSGAGDARSQRSLAEGLLQLGAEWTPSRYFDAHVHGLARSRPRGGRGRDAGLAEAYVDGHAFFGAVDEVQLRAGQFFLPTSRENREELWTSPYSITWSTLNSWIGEEVRPVGVDLQWKHGFYITAGVTAFRDNDTMGALLGWRGWASGNRLSLFDEVVPLPPLDTLVSGSFSRFQRRDGSTPFKHDLDGRTGFAERIRLSLPERGNIQVTHLDNRGDRLLHEREYAWATRYDQVSAEVGDSEGTIVAAEYMTGRSAMGRPQFAHVDINFHSGYVLLSKKNGRWRGTLRAERFSTTDNVQIDEGEYGERGHAWTAAVLYEVTPHARAALELTRITGPRRAILESGGDPDAGGRAVTLELRYKF